MSYTIGREPEKLAEIAGRAVNSDVRLVQIPGAKHDSMENREAMVM